MIDMIQHLYLIAYLNGFYIKSYKEAQRMAPKFDDMLSQHTEMYCPCQNMRNENSICPCSYLIKHNACKCNLMSKEKLGEYKHLRVSGLRMPDRNPYIQGLVCSDNKNNTLFVSLGLTEEQRKYYASDFTFDELLGWVVLIYIPNDGTEPIFIDKTLRQKGEIDIL